MHQQCCPKGLTAMDRILPLTLMVMCTVLTTHANFCFFHSSKNCSLTCVSRLESEIRVCEGHNTSLSDQTPSLRCWNLGENV